jgi:hypothetical protein
VLWIAHEWAPQPIVALGFSGIAYGAVYFGLSFANVRSVMVKETVPCAASQA